MRTDQLIATARPYAAAAFAEAFAENKIAAWSNMLEAAAMVTQNHAVRSLLNRPGIEPDRLAQFYIEILSSLLTPEMEHFLHLLATNRRLPLLIQIWDAFLARRSEFENKVTVKVVSAIPLNADYQQKFSNALTNRLQREVHLECEEDPNLLGGVVLKVGDKVIDGSVRGKLQRMVEYITGKM